MVLSAATQFRRFLTDMLQVANHLAPAIPQRIVRVGMERALEGAHAVFQVHLEQALFDRRRRIMEGQQIRKCVSVALRLRKNAVLVKRSDFADRFGEQVVGFANQIVSLGKLGAGEIT